MKASSLPNLNREPTSYNNFFTLLQDPNHHDDTTLNKHPNIDHSQVSEPSETSPFKDILSPLVSFNGSNENHYPVGEYLYEQDQNHKDQTLPRSPPSPTKVTQLRRDQTQPNVTQLERPTETWTTITSTLIDDGHAWMENGQSDILHAKYPRNYYSCIHSYNQRCLATKQVQRTDEDPPMYQTTYRGNHTCRNPPPQPTCMSKHVLDDSDLWVAFL